MKWFCIKCERFSTFGGFCPECNISKILNKAEIVGVPFDDSEDSQ